MITTVEAKEVIGIRVELPAGSGAVMHNIYAVFARQVAQRCGATVTNEGVAPLTVALAIDPAIGTEGFRISDRDAGTIEVAGQNSLGVLYGLGKLLRISRYSQTGFTPGAWRGESVPEKPIRGMYFATHFHNFYHDGPVEAIQRYVEDLALWGCNNLMVWYDMNHFNGFQDPEAVAFRERLRGILEIASGLGLGTTFLVIGNEGYADSPAAMRSKGGGRGGVYESAVCPSAPGALDYRLDIHAEMLDWMRAFNPQYICIWPYDQGGCNCEQCRPWATRGFLECAKLLARMSREKLPGVKIILSNWYYTKEETQELGKLLAVDEPWVDYVMGPVPGTSIPAVNFPEISMLSVQPWGGFGAIPVPQELQQKYAEMTNLGGGWPYSEGIFEDMNKIVMLQLFWNPAQPTQESIREYAAFEFGSDVADEVVAIVQAVEKNFRSRRNIGADALTAFAQAQKVAAELPPAIRTGWRWRILYLRALIDKEMHLTKGALKGDVLRDAFGELTQIYHAENALLGWLRPPRVEGDSGASEMTEEKLDLDPRERENQ